MFLRTDPEKCQIILKEIKKRIIKLRQLRRAKLRLKDVCAHCYCTLLLRTQIHTPQHASTGHWILPSWDYKVRETTVYGRYKFGELGLNEPQQLTTFTPPKQYLAENISCQNISNCNIFGLTDSLIRWQSPKSVIPIFLFLPFWLSRS